MAPGELGPTPEALAAYEAVRKPLASEVQRWSLKVRVHGAAPCPGQPRHLARMDVPHAAASSRRMHPHCTWAVQRDGHATLGQPLRPPPCHFYLPTPPYPAPQLLRQMQEGKSGPTEVDVNIEQGFIKRQHAPLVPRSA